MAKGAPARRREATRETGAVLAPWVIGQGGVWRWETLRGGTAGRVMLQGRSTARGRARAVPEADLVGFELQRRYQRYQDSRAQWNVPPQDP